MAQCSGWHRRFFTASMHGSTWILRSYSLTCLLWINFECEDFSSTEYAQRHLLATNEKKIIEDPYFKYISLVIPISLTCIIFSSD